MKFQKWQGLGNDFVIVNTEKYREFDFQGSARKICDRHFGVGADCLVTVAPLGGHSFEMRIYNADGSETEMCGNATRCVGMYIKQNKLAPGREFQLHTKAGIIKPQVLENGAVRVDMGEPRLTRGEIPVTGDPGEKALELRFEACGRKFTGTALSMGNPHIVIFVDDINQIQLAEWGPQIETHELFPRKVNVEFAEVISPQLVRMRVWERGCGITMACGTGSCATAVAGVLTGRTGRNISVLLDGGELQIEYSEKDNHVYMTGPATFAFEGELIKN